MPVPRLHVDQTLRAGAELPLPPNAARHVQVLRLQPGDALILFDGNGGQWEAQVTRMGRQDVVARALAHREVERELACRVTIALGMPANERMDALIEKATELGAAAIQPLVCERSVLRVAGERAQRKLAHWRSVVASSCEQCGRNHLPELAAPLALRDWIEALADTAGDARLLLSLDDSATALMRWAEAHRPLALTLLSGPEGGLSAGEQALAIERASFVPVSLGPRVLRADTAPLAALACIAALEGRP